MPGLHLSARGKDGANKIFSGRPRPPPLPPPPPRLQREGPLQYSLQWEGQRQQQLRRLLHKKSIIPRGHPPLSPQQITFCQWRLSLRFRPVLAYMNKAGIILNFGLIVKRAPTLSPTHLASPESGYRKRIFYRVPRWPKHKLVLCGCIPKSQSPFHKGEHND